MIDDDETERVRAVALRTAASIVAARDKAERELLLTKEAFERKSEELVTALALTRATLDATTDALLVVDSNGNIRAQNAKLLALWGLTAAELDGVPHERVASGFVHKVADVDAFRRRLDAIYAAPLAESFDVIALDDGRVLERSSTPHVVGDAVVGRVWSFRDVTDRRRTEDAERAARANLERANLVKDEFLATLSHELRSPLNTILGWADLLARKAHADKQLLQGLETIARSARAQARIIEDLLDMSRIASGILHLEVQPTELTSVAAAAVDAVRLSAESKGVTLQARIDPSCPTVAADPHRLQQVLVNLLSNAVKFTDHGGKVHLSAAAVGPNVELVVRDTGKGIDADFLPHIFERFSQEADGVRRPHPGLGLGLAIVKQLVELHGGTVTAESAGIGSGATFVVRLPIAARSVPTAEKRRRPTPGARGAAPLIGVKVLVVEDDPDVREHLSHVLRSAGAEVLTASDASQGVAMLTSERPDVLISDIGMPEKDGLQFIRRVRRLAASEGGHTPAIALTAFARPEDRAQTLAAGFQVHLVKPAAPGELITTVGGLVGR